jgi:hypothetical protein
LLKAKKFKQTISTRTTMCTIFWERQGVPLVEFSHTGTTIYSASYCETVKKLQHATENKKARMLNYSILLLHEILGRTLLLTFKMSSPHLDGKKWTTPHTALT